MPTPAGHRKTSNPRIPIRELCQSFQRVRLAPTDIMASLMAIGAGTAVAAFLVRLP